MKAIVLTETADAAAQLCAGARTMADEVVLICVGTDAVTGVADKCIHIDVPAENVAEDAYLSVSSAFDAEGANLVLAEPTRRCKALAGRLAAHKGTSVITDVVEFTDAGAKNLYFGGVGERVSKASSPVAIYTVGAGVFNPAFATGTDTVEEMEFTAPAVAIQCVQTKTLPSTGVDLTKSDIIFAAGRGFAEESDLDLARAVCEKIGAGLACSRPLTEGVDWMPRGSYVGVSGLMLTPKVYIAAGISGQMQHMVGCNRSGALFAINKDKNAAVFKQCDCGIVGDIRDVLPALVAAL